MILDTLERPLRNLRLSVTDRCNLRCRYCMPEEEYVWLPREDILSFEECALLVEVFCDLGVDKVRLTGGEPLLRKGVESLIRMLAANPRIKDLAMTTNGVLLAEHAPLLREAGLHRVTVSLDTLRADRFKALAQRELHPRVLEGSSARSAAPLRRPSVSTPSVSTALRPVRRASRRRSPRLSPSARRRPRGSPRRGMPPRGHASPPRRRPSRGRTPAGGAARG